MSTNSDAFKNAIEMAADKSKSELLSEGKIEPMVFFAHADGTMKRQYLSRSKMSTRERQLCGGYERRHWLRISLPLSYCLKWTMSMECFSRESVLA
jgi:hypothetical protein